MMLEGALSRPIETKCLMYVLCKLIYFFIFQEPVSDEPKTLTLDEWKAQQGKKEGPKFNVRKAGEGSEIDPKWKKATIYKKENEEESEEEEEEEV